MFSITKDDYFNKNQPAKSEELANFIEVYTQPLSFATNSEVYRSKDSISIAAHSTATIDVIYEKQPVQNTTITLDDTVSIVVASSSVYVWGARITLENPSDTIDSAIIVVTGNQLVVTGEEIISTSDDLSVREFGIQKYTLPKNHLIQTRSMAQKVAGVLLSSYKQIRKDVDLDWRGNPALELTDEIEVPEYQKNGIDQRGTFYITKNIFNFDGTLRQQTNGRKTE